MQNQDQNHNQNMNQNMKQNLNQNLQKVEQKEQNIEDKKYLKKNNQTPQICLVKNVKNLMKKEESKKGKG